MVNFNVFLIKCLVSCVDLYPFVLWHKSNTVRNTNRIDMIILLNAVTKQTKKISINVNVLYVKFIP